MDLWEVRARVVTPDKQFRVRVWHVWGQKPDSDATGTFQDWLAEKVLDYYTHAVGPDGRASDVGIAEYLVQTVGMDTVEVTQIDTEVGVTYYRTWP